MERKPAPGLYVGPVEQQENARSEDVDYTLRVRCNTERRNKGNREET